MAALPPYYADHGLASWDSAEIGFRMVQADLQGCSVVAQILLNTMSVFMHAYAWAYIPAAAQV